MENLKTNLAGAVLLAANLAVIFLRMFGKIDNAQAADAMQALAGLGSGALFWAKDRKP